ncbi:unnamed protein product [Caenorhabditis auriculariae]|uniref:Uncharacterized protein n=1 Tax=Caenorhabditis auriculariae TaxID=2777116 RepID=A0A8S1HPD8_9PELO|nr:unnamed protein product [Caenorhabditis auriculariae]
MGEAGTAPPSYNIPPPSYDDVTSGTYPQPPPPPPAQPSVQSNTLNQSRTTVNNYRIYVIPERTVRVRPTVRVDPGGLCEPDELVKSKGDG